MTGIWVPAGQSPVDMAVMDMVTTTTAVGMAAAGAILVRGYMGGIACVETRRGMMRGGSGRGDMMGSSRGDMSGNYNDRNGGWGGYDSGSQRTTAGQVDAPQNSGRSSNDWSQGYSGGWQKADGQQTANQHNHDVANQYMVDSVLKTVAAHRRAEVVLRMEVDHQKRGSSRNDGMSERGNHLQG